jgi:hypothetical protein
MEQQFNTKEYALSKINEFRYRYPNLDVSNLAPATFPQTLKNVNLTDKQMAQLPFDPIVLSAICGSLFGDSSIAINKGYANARIQYRHSTRQSDWFMWKTFCIYKEFINDTSICWQKSDGFQKQVPVKEGEILGKWKVATKGDEKLTKLYNIICPKKTKELQRFWLNHMNNYFLMTLWLDDGSLVGQRQGILSCNNTPIDQAKILANYISKVWEVECKVVEVPSKATATLLQPVQIVINDLDNLEKFLRIIAPIVPVKSMLYKVCLYPIESSRLQRWTSELKTLVRQDWHADIDQIYVDLKKAATALKE